LISGDYAGALPNFDIAHETFKSLSLPNDVARTMITLGATTAATVESDAGPNMVIAALDACRNLGDWHSAGVALIALGEGARGGGDMLAAAQCYEEALALMRQANDQYWMGALLLNMCHVLLSKSDVDGARQYLREAIQLANEYDYTMMINLYVALAGEIALKESNVEDAARLFGAATAMLHHVGVSFEPVDQMQFDEAIALAKEQLGPQRFSELHAEGMSWDKSRSLESAASIARHV
jgi:tetratricopeptide (TPR) repeat protein